MDKLEKAMEKARQERQANLQNGIAPKPVGPRIFDHVGGGPDVIKSDALKVDENELEHHRILAHHTRNAQADIFRILRTQVLQIMHKSGFRTLAVTSPNYGDGKTTISLNLAVSIAMDLKQTVLLADLDLRKPNLHEFLGLKPTTGLSDYLTNNVPIADSLHRLTFERLSILPAGQPLDNSSEVLGSPKMAVLAEELKTRYTDRLVIYDMPPLLAQDDSIAFLPHVDAVLVVFRDGVTTKDEIKQCLEMLSNTNVIGTVLNNSGTRPVKRKGIFGKKHRKAKHEA